MKTHELLYRKWILPGRNSEEMAAEQFGILPRSCRDKVAHSILMAGHLGKDKTCVTHVSQCVCDIRDGVTWVIVTV